MGKIVIFTPCYNRLLVKLSRVCSTTTKALKHKQKRAECGKISARETGDIPKKAYIWDGGVNV